MERARPPRLPRAARQEPGQREVRTAGGWIPSPEGPLAAWVTAADQPCTLGVVVLPAFGYESSSSYRTTRALAEAAARRGARVLRVDYPGTGDSAGSAAEVSFASLRVALPAAVSALRSLGAREVSVVGLRLGALLALLGAFEAGVTEVVAWAPVLPGRRAVRELRLLADSAPPEAGLGDDGLLLAGHAFPGSLLAELTTLALDERALRGLRRVVVADRDDRPVSAALLDLARAAGVPVEHVVLSGHAGFLDRPAEDGAVPVAAVEELATACLPRWAAAQTTESTAADPLPTVATMALVGGNAVVEEHVVLGARRLVAVRTVVAETAPSVTLALLNSGSDPHHGPGRAWVDLARGLAPRGVEMLRVDFTGWGESPPDPRASGRPYDLHVLDDLHDLVDGLRRRGSGRRVVLGGLCAGAWLALHVARTLHVDGVVALNPQLYWQPGDPVEALLSDTRERRQVEIALIRAEQAAGRWDAEDAAGLLPPEGLWLQELSDARVPVDLLFAPDDDGLAHLRDRLGRRTVALQKAGWLAVTELPGVDHAMTRAWLRPQVVDAVARALDRQAGLTRAAP